MNADFPFLSLRRAASRTAVAKSESESRYYQAQAQVPMERGRLDTQKMIENTKVKLEAAKGLAGANIAGGEKLTRMANASLAGMNRVVSAEQQ